MDPNPTSSITTPPEDSIAETKNSSPLTPLFYILGLGILGYLLTRTPFEPILESLRAVGAAICIFFAVAPFWFAANTLSLKNLTNNKIGFWRLYYATLVGEAYNVIVPLAGLAGEPLKIKQISRSIPLADATQAIVRDRVIHALSGPLYATLVLTLSLLLAPLSETATTTLIVLTIAIFAKTVILFGLLFSRLPARLSQFLLDRVSALRPLVSGWEQIGFKTLAVSLACKMLARSINLIEIWIAFKLLGLAGSPDQVLLVAAFITLSAVFFFVIPQGLGVNEAGIAGALTLLGFEASVGLTFGLMRRARVLFWALAGVAIHLPFFLFSRIFRKPAAVTNQSGAGKVALE